MRIVIAAVGRLRREIRQHGAELLYSNSGLPCQAGHYAARSSGIAARSNACANARAASR